MRQEPTPGGPLPQPKVLAAPQLNPSYASGAKYYEYLYMKNGTVPLNSHVSSICTEPAWLIVST